MRGEQELVGHEEQARHAPTLVKKRLITHSYKNFLLILLLLRAKRKPVFDFLQQKMSTLDAMKLTELRELCKKQGVQASGNKSTLMSRLSGPSRVSYPLMLPDAVAQTLQLTYVGKQKDKSGLMTFMYDKTTSPVAAASACASGVCTKIAKKKEKKNKEPKTTKTTTFVSDEAYEEAQEMVRERLGKLTDSTLRAILTDFNEPTAGRQRKRMIEVAVE